jgi:transcriptional regulator with XRE-family HTH domain
MEKELIKNSLLIYRKKAVLTQMVVAKKLGFTSAERISAWEKGKALPGVINLFKLSVIYDSLPHMLFENVYHEIKLNKLLNKNINDNEY